MSALQNKFCFVQFKFNQRTSPGEEIHVTGDIPSLGLWDVNKSEKMVTNHEDYPLWKSKENIICLQDTEIQYKYLIFRGGKFSSWENNSNRHVKIGKYCKVVVMDPGSKIVHCISDPNLNNITNSEISKCENNFIEDDSKIINLDIDDMGFNSIDVYNNDIFSGQSINAYNNEDQYILSNKKNDLILESQLKKFNLLYEDLNADYNNNDSNSNNNDNNETININNIEFNIDNRNLMENIIKEIEPINKQIFNNVIINGNQISQDNKELDICKMDSNISEIENKLSSDNMPLIGIDSLKNDLIFVNKKNNLYQKIIICTLYLPVEIQDEEIIPLSDYIYPSLYELKNYNDNIYFIGLLKNDKNINEKNKENIYKKLKNEYKMFPVEVDINFKNEIFDFFNKIVNPYLSNIKIDIYNLKNYNINNLINEILYKFNIIIYKNILELVGKEKFLLLLFDYYFIFVPLLLIRGEKENDIKNDKIDDNVGIQYIFLNQIPEKSKFIQIPNYQNILKSLLYSNLIIFPSYINCYKFLYLTELNEDIEYKININGDITLTINDNLKKLDDSNDNSLRRKNIILKVENILPDYKIFKSLLENKEKLDNLEIRENIDNLTKKDKYFVFLSIDDYKYIPLIKIKLLGFKLFNEDTLEEKQKLIFIQIITGNPNDKNNLNNNININAEKQKKENKNSGIMEEINLIKNEINYNSENKKIEIYYKDLNIYEKIYLLNKADCFIKTSDEINSPFSIYEYLMAKLIGFKNKNEMDLSDKNEEKNLNINNNKYKINKIEPILKNDFPIIEYIISNQIKEIPGINKFIYANPFEIKNISMELTKAYRNLINFHKNNNNNFIEEHSKENDFKYIEKYFCNNKFYCYKYYNIDFQNQITKENNIEDNLGKNSLNKIDINKIDKDYSFILQYDNNIGIKIISINLDFFLDNYSSKNENEKLHKLLDNLISLSLLGENNKIILFSKKDESELDDIFQNYLNKYSEKYKTNQLNLIKNFILTSSNGYSFKKFCNYFEEDDIVNKWIKIFYNSEQLRFTEQDIINNIVSYRQNCFGIKIDQKSNKILIYNDDCNKEQLDAYMGYFQCQLDDNNLNQIFIIKKISNGYSIINSFNYKAYFISRIIKEIFSKDKQPIFIMHLGYNQTDEILYKYFEDKKGNIEKYSKKEIIIYCIKLINKNIVINESSNSQEHNYKNLFYEDNIDEMISLFQKLLENENSKIVK